MQDLIKECKVPLEAGAVPPLPQIYGVRGLMDSALAADETIFFKAGNNHQVIGMAMSAFRSLASFIVLPFAQEQDVQLKCAS
jgi:prolyl-tRNA editing enzyme YbaK/EbsC (Cys-tRNA(Pro) deacylase)